ncbi:sugar nucleotide-binding protein [Candidatus Pelagibacter sp.]|nr:sugar nucleotide-binding protein [Candidatus Pelagibacter sp.]
MTKLILVTGGNGRFAKILKRKNKILDLKFLSKKELNILDTKSIEKNIIKYEPKIILHTAALSRPMAIHNTDITKSINLNIIGTANIVKLCEKYRVKLIYFSTGYVYECTKGNYKESDPVKPINNYGLSKLGGECAVQMYKNSLILRITMTEKPFAYKKAFTNVFSNYMFHEEMVEMLPKLINQFGIINVGGKSRSIYNFAKNHNKKVIKIKNFDKKIYSKQTMNLKRLKKILN